MRRLVETLNEAKMPDFPIVISLYDRVNTISKRLLAIDYYII